MNIYSAKKEREKYLREKQNDREKHIYNKPIKNYQQFIRDNQKRIKEEFPELSNTERFTKLAEEWNKFKATLVDKEEDKEDKEEPSDEDKEDKEEEQEKPKEDEGKEKKPKKAKKTTKKGE